MNKLVLFDFDGTITSRDTFISFIQFTNGYFMTYLGLFLLSPVLVAFKLNLIPNYRAKELVMRYFWFGRSLEWMHEQGELFCDQKITEYIREEAFDKIKWYQDEGWKVVIVTASSPIWISKWVKRWSLDIIGTNLEVVDGQLTGKIKGKNCYGEEKVRRVKDSFKIDEFKEIHVYGDSKGDLELLKLGHKSFYKPFRD